jgi:hypothetical protein
MKKLIKKIIINLFFIKMRIFLFYWPAFHLKEKSEIERLYFNSWVLVSSKLEGYTFQNLKVSSPAPVTIVYPSGLIAKYKTLKFFL